MTAEARPSWWNTMTDGWVNHRIPQALNQFSQAEMTDFVRYRALMTQPPNPPVEGTREVSYSDLLLFAVHEPEIRPKVISSIGELLDTYTTRLAKGAAMTEEEERGLNNLGLVVMRAAEYPEAQTNPHIKPSIVALSRILMEADGESAVSGCFVNARQIYDEPGDPINDWLNWWETTTPKRATLVFMGLAKVDPELALDRIAEAVQKIPDTYYALASLCGSLNSAKPTKGAIRILQELERISQSSEDKIDGIEKAIEVSRNFTDESYWTN